MKLTRRDHTNAHTLAALAHLESARDCRQRYADLLDASIMHYGDRHNPEKVSVRDTCAVCEAHGLHHDENERLNHQTGRIIADIYADHFLVRMNGY